MTLSKRELEKAATDFLREHDTYFKSKRKNKVMDYPYLSKRQWQLRLATEIPASNLSVRQNMAKAKLDSLETEEM